jgi:hypothetical protein
MTKLKLQDMTAESLSLTRAERTSQNPLGKFFNMLEKVATENNPSDTPGYLFNIYGSGIQINNKPDFVITESSRFNIGRKECKY